MVSIKQILCIRLCEVVEKGYEVIGKEGRVCIFGCGERNTSKSHIYL